MAVDRFGGFVEKSVPRAVSCQAATAYDACRGDNRADAGPEEGRSREGGVSAYECFLLS